MHKEKWGLNFHQSIFHTTTILYFVLDYIKIRRIIQVCKQQYLLHCLHVVYCYHLEVLWFTSKDEIQILFIYDNKALNLDLYDALTISLYLWLFSHSCLVFSLHSFVFVQRGTLSLLTGKLPAAGLFRDQINKWLIKASIAYLTAVTVISEEG